MLTAAVIAEDVLHNSQALKAQIIDITEDASAQGISVDLSIF